MKNHLIQTFAIFIIAIFLASCQSTKDTSPTVISTSTFTAIPSTPTIVPSQTFTAGLPTPTQASAQAPQTMCVHATTWDMSPNGEWRTAGFYLGEEPFLRVVNLDCSKSWEIYISNYKEKGSFDEHDGVIPNHWSKDGKFLYAIVGQRLSGCCWKGHRYVLLIRLDLETGKQIAILNTSPNSPFDFTISDSDHYIIFTPPSKQSYDFAILDLVTWKTREFTITETIDVVYAVMSPNDEKIVLPLFRNIDYDNYFVDSIALIDLKTGKKELLVSGLTEEKQLYPFHWVDESHILLGNTDPKFDIDNQSSTEYWLLNIDSHKIEKQ